MNMSNSEIAKILMSNDHLNDEDKEVLLKILGMKSDNEKNTSFSERVSDCFTNFIGSWKFILISIVFIIVWMIHNAIFVVRCRHYCCAGDVVDLFTNSRKLSCKFKRNMCTAFVYT